MDKEIRNKIKKMVQDARKELLKEIGELLEGVFGLHKDGTIEDISRLPQIKDDQNAIKAREGFAYVIERETAVGSKKPDAVERLILGLTFTHLNRLVALKLMERRKVIRETVSRGSKSNGFVHYVVDVLKKTDLSQLENIDIAYQDYILYQCREVAEEIKVLFDPEDLSSYVFPRPRALKTVLEVINNPEIDNIWDFDETIGWFYQYFTPKEIREQARAESSAPRNSWELAFRNQFYTPRYVVQFLADNTLGRIWYEMMQGNTKLAKSCEYMVKPRNEVFLQKNEKSSAQTDSFQVPFREKKDPRLLKILDPACGSGHFLLYVFNLLMIIYREAYGDKDLGMALQKDYPDKEAFEREIPRLILENNLYGIDIDLRAIQIAALALWLMAQREWIRIRREDRPRIRNAHFVCAEPMPGNQKLFEDFISTLKPALLGDLVRNVWEKMKLAGEAGSLLQIEQELRTAIHNAKQKWKSLPRPVQLTLFGKSEPGQLSFALSEIKDEAFFKEAEEKVFSALRDYAEKVKAENHGYSRRLFAEESIRGFQFIEVLQNRFDVVLMNPPFGYPSILTKAYLDKAYPNSKYDLFGMFIERGIDLLVQNGHIGAITTRTGFYIVTFDYWRKEIILKHTYMKYFADLGLGVLESAMVETAAYILEKSKPSVSQGSWFIRLLSEKDKMIAMKKAIYSINIQSELSDIFYVPQKDFFLVDGAPIAYWISSLKFHFQKHPSLESVGVEVRVGLQTGDDFRFLRVWWEVQPSKVALNRKWVPLAKGGEYRKYYDDIYLLVNWINQGIEIKNFYGTNGELRSRPQNEKYYFKSGLTYPMRTRSNFSPRALPSSCIFNVQGNSIFSSYENDKICLLSILAIVSSRTFEAFTRIKSRIGDMSTAGGAGFAYTPGLIQSMPFPKLNESEQKMMSDLMEQCYKAERNKDVGVENTHVFSHNILIEHNKQKLNEQFLLKLTSYESRCLEIMEASHKSEQLTINAYGLSESDIKEIKSQFGKHPIEYPQIEPDEKRFKEIYLSKRQIEMESEDNDLEPMEVDKGIERASQLKAFKTSDYLTIEDMALLIGLSPISIVKKRRELHIYRLEEFRVSIEELLMYLLGCIYGRWDVRMALDKSLIPKLADTFDPLPVCSPGMLLSPDGYPATSGRIVSEAWLKRRVNVLDVPTDVPSPTIADKDYPIQIDWDGILVDDEGHSDDIVKKVHKVLTLIYGEHTDEREREILEILDIKNLRDYFRQPKRFFDFHIKRYSKSRRKAPIYWLLQTKKKNYGIWFYYHRLDNDTLFKALRNYVEPKLNLISSQILEASQKVVNTDGRDKRTYEKELEKLEELRQEIAEFKEELEKVAKMGYDPNFDDGMILNMAPLHTVIPWNEPAKYWKDLESGKYDWAHIAMKYWPERVKAKCKKDKSLAIAHGCE